MKRALVLITGLLAALVPFITSNLPAAHAGVLSQSDGGGDVVDPTIGCYRTVVPQSCPAAKSTTPGRDQFDITGYSFNADGSHFNANVTTVGAWPYQGLNATDSVNFAKYAGVKEFEVRWIFGSSAQQSVHNIGNICTASSNNVENTVTLTYGNGYCGPDFEGPFFVADGFKLFIGVTATLVNGAWDWDWEYGWYEGVTQIFWSNPASATHDKIVGQPDPGVISGKGTNNISLRVPYGLQEEFNSTSGLNGSSTLTHVFAELNGSITGVTTATYGNITVSEPDPALCPASNSGYQSADVPGVASPGSTVGGVVAPVVRNNAPAPYNRTDNCYTRGVGVTFVADWAPGNGTTMDWGGFLPRQFPRSPSYVAGSGVPNTVNAGAGLCAYPAGLAVGSIDPLIDGNSVYQFTGGITVSAAGHSASAPGVPTNPWPNLFVSNPAVRNKPCGNIQVPTGLFFTDASGSTAS